MECVFRASALVALVLLAGADGAEVTQCSHSSAPADPAELRDTLRQSACRFNSTEIAAFHAHVQLKHGKSGDLPYFAFAPLFNYFTNKVWCRTLCPDVSAQNITWCVNIAYLEEDIETCITPGNTEQPVTNSSCGAQVVGLDSFLSLPSNCAFHGDVGCLGLTNLDWFFKDAYLTCTVHTESCYEKTFTHFRALLGGTLSQPPEIDDFPTSLSVLPGTRMVLRAEVTSTTSTMYTAWRHGNKTYSHFIEEDPFCNHQVEQCRIDNHPNATQLKQQRVQLYRFTRAIPLTGCQNNIIYRLESYLIINNTALDDAGEYTFNITNRNRNSPPLSTWRSVNVSVECRLPSALASCSNSSFSLVRGASVTWRCQLTAPPSASLHLRLNHTAILLASQPRPSCGKDPQVSFHIQETPSHVCYSNFTVVVVICSANESVVGDFRVMRSSGAVANGTLVVVKLAPQPTVEGKSGPKLSEHVAYSVPLGVLVGSLVLMVLVLLLVLRSRKKRRTRRLTAHMQSPTLKEVSLLTKEGELGLLFPNSPLSPHHGNTSPSDPLEFPRSRLYIYHNKVLGEGSFGRVLQAKAEGIVPGMPERNVVAIKTTKDNATSVEREELLAELDLMRGMEPHENILNLLGQCTTPGGPVCLIVEFATYGNLRDFLRQCEEVVLSLNHLPHIPRNRSRTRTFSSSSYSSTQPLIVRQDSVFTPTSGQTHFVFPSPTAPTTSPGSSPGREGKMTAQHPGTTMPLAHSVAPIGHDYINTKGLVYMEDVHNFALQIACGLQHLASMQIVHCDLAARNVLIAEGFVLKIADFGLARDISGRELYKKNPRGKIPVKWTAPEALERRVFTTKSDVWSYGVLLWELFTYGHTPYPDVQLGPSFEPFIAYLKEGHRMSQPESSPPTFYELMLECWHLDPDLRPAPHDIVAQLTPSDSIFDDADSELNTDQPITPKPTTGVASGGHQSSQE